MTTPPIDVPPLGPTRPPTTPQHHTYRLASGLVLSAVLQSSTPTAHIRLRIPAAGAPPAPGVLLAQWMFRPDRLIAGIPFAERAADCGARFTATLDTETLQVTAHCLASRLPEALGLLATVLVDPTIATSMTENDIAATAHGMRIAKSRPGLLALEALNAAAYGTHPYAVPSPNERQILATTTEDVEALRETLLRPDGATLAVVGDCDPAEVAAHTESALADWSGTSEYAAVRPIPDRFAPVARWHRLPGAVRTSVRLAMRAPRRTSAPYAPLKIANLVLGGYFSSRLTAELRDRRGLCYSVRSAFAHTRAGAVVLISAEVDGQRTAGGLRSLCEVLLDMNDKPITADEYAHAQRYAVGSQQLAQATQSELADWAVELAPEETNISWLRRHALDLMNVDLDAVRGESEQYFQPRHAAIGLASAPELLGSTFDELRAAGFHIEADGD